MEGRRINTETIGLSAPPDKLLIEIIKKEKSGVIYVKEDEEAPTQGIVLSNGEDTYEGWKGKEIIFKKYAGQRFTFQYRDFMSILETDVLAVIL